MTSSILQLKGIYVHLFTIVQLCVYIYISIYTCMCINNLVFAIGSHQLVYLV